MTKVIAFYSTTYWIQTSALSAMCSNS